MLRRDIKSYSYEELEALIAELGEKSFRAKQLYEWMHVKVADSYDMMTNVPGKLKDALKKDYQLTTLEMVRVQESKEDGTRK